MPDTLNNSIPSLISCFGERMMDSHVLCFTIIESPHIIFWFGIPLIYFKLRSKTSVNYISPTRSQLRLGIIALLFIGSIMNLILKSNDLPNNISLFQLIYSVFFYGLISTAILLHIKEKQSIQGSIYLSLLLSAAIKITLLIVKITDFSLDAALCAEVTLLMMETYLLSLSDEPINKKDESPEVYSSLFSKLFFSWMTRIINSGSKRELTFKDLYKLKEEGTSKQLLEKWDQEWFATQEAQKLQNKFNNTSKPASIVWPFIRSHYSLIINITFCRLISDIIHYFNPMLLKQFIDFASLPEAPLSLGISIACLMFISAETRSFLQNHQVFGMFKLNVFYQSVLTNELLRKTLRLSPSERAKRTTGEILNMASVDIEKVVGAIPYLQNLWSVPFQITLAMIMLWITLGPATLAGLLIMALFVPLNYYSSKHIKKAQIAQMKVKDQRIAISNELLNGVKIVKLYAWEEAFEKKITALRNEEVRLLKWVSVAGRMIDAANAAAPFLVALASLSTFVLTSEKYALTPSIAFVSLAIFNQIRQPMRLVGMMINTLTQAMVSNRRLKHFFASEELQLDSVGKQTENDAIVLCNASLNWKGDNNPALLKDLKLRISKGQSVAVVGPVGSGKSSLLSSIIGEMHLLSGKIDVDGRVAYVPQETWIIHETLKENILLGASYRKEDYDRVIQACELTKDFLMFPHGDATEIGEHGINLSGGQKARIGLARAVYQNCDIYLLDDPFSAIDSHVGSNIFNNLFGKEGFLAKKTRILITHSLQYTKHGDYILVINEGRIVERGTYDEIQSAGGMFTYLLKEKKGNVQSTYSTDTKSGDDMTIPNFESGETSQTVVKETNHREQLQIGRVKPSVYLLYLKSMRLRNTIGFFLFFVFHYICIIFRSLWLSDWSNSNTLAIRNSTIPITTRLLVYGGFGLLEILMIVASFIFLIAGSVYSSKRLHSPVINALLHAPITFYDITPAGRIINRLSRDLEVIDMLPGTLRQFTQSSLHVLMIIFLVSYITPLFVIVVTPIIIGYFSILIYFISTIRQFKRMESIRRSPILTTFGDCIRNISSIRAYKKVDSISAQLASNIDKFTQCRYLSISANRWLATRLELLGNTVVISSAVLGSISVKYFSLSAGLVGLSVSYALSITEVLNMAVRMIGEMETNVVSVERIKEYHSIKSEGNWGEEQTKEKIDASKGSITINNYYMRYRDDLPQIIKGVTVQISAGEKVAVIGRTGSGKSSLGLGLFRIIEADGGYIEIDGVRTDTMGLHELRKKITMIPQEPILFSGTLRFNLDPTNQYSDSEIWKVLDACQLKEFASSRPEGLGYTIHDGGKNMSVGERQLVCLGRALLRSACILVLDEATAAIDSVTDKLVQKVVRENFPNTTTITIAHRLDTIADYDRIMVMEAGKVVEYDTPDNLLRNRNSIYSQMLEKQWIK